MDTTAQGAQPGQKGYPVIRTTGEDHAELDWTDDAADADRLLFATPVRPPKDADRWEAVGGYPVRHGQFSKRVFRPAVKATLPQLADYANRRGLRWHDLRHTCASLSLAVSPNLHVVKERLGHKDIRMTINTYGHLVPSVDRALADGLGAMFEADNVVPLRGAA